MKSQNNHSVVYGAATEKFDATGIGCFHLYFDSKNPKTISDAVFSSTLPLLLPSGHVSIPLLTISNETIRFLHDCNTQGFEKTLQKFNVELSSKYVGPNLANELWKNVQPKIDPKIVNSPFSKLAERAFRKTISSIVAKGSDALGDDS